MDMRMLALTFFLIISGVAYGAAEHARLSAARADLVTIKTAFDRFAIDCGSYPSTSEGFAALLNCPTNISPSRWRGPYLDRKPIDPWGNDYVYREPGIHNTKSFDLYSCGADGISKSGGSDPDDTNNWDPNSFRENLSDYFRTNGRTVALPLLFGALLLIIGSLAVAPFSPRVRNLIVRNILIWVLLAGLLLLLLFLSLPQIAT